MKKAIIFGAGNIGRGFIGQLFAESGFETTFIDIDQDLLNLFETKHAYNLETVFNDEKKAFRIGPVRGVSADCAETVADVIAHAEIGATAVGARALPFIADHLARGIARRARVGAPPLNMIICENLKNAATIIRGMVAERIAPEARDYLEQSIGFVDTVIGRMVPPPTPEMRQNDPGLIRVEPYCELPVDQNGFRGPIPEITAMTAYDDFPRFTARKFYIHNCGHAMLSYFGYLKKVEFGWQALQDPEISQHLFNGWEESAHGIATRYGAEMDWLKEHMQDLYQRFQNRSLGDTIFRLGRDPVRKLGPTDRLVAPARLVLESGRFPAHIARSIAQAFQFDPPEDPVAVALQTRIAEQGLPTVMQDVCSISPQEKLGTYILKCYTES